MVLLHVQIYVHLYTILYGYCNAKKLSFPYCERCCGKRVLFTVGHCLVSIVLITWCHIVMDLGYMALSVRCLVNGERCLVFVRPYFGQTDLHNEIK